MDMIPEVKIKIGVKNMSYDQYSQQEIKDGEVPQIVRLCPVTALEGIHEDMESSRSQSTAVETLVEAATRVDSQKEQREDHKDGANDYRQQCVGEVRWAKILGAIHAC